MTVFVVAGWMRSGTSMMMGALEAGGLATASSPIREQEARARFDDGTYLGNKGGYFELTMGEIAAAEFPLPYRNKAVKILRHIALHLPAYDGDYRVVVMRREPEEIRQSMQALMQQAFPVEINTHIAESVERLLGILRQRRDVSVVQLSYRDVIERPAHELSKLVADGWPIDVLRAAAIVDPALCRYRLESLDVGA